MIRSILALLLVASVASAETPLERYYAMEQIARTEGKPLVVWVGSAHRAEGVVNVHVKTFNDIAGPAAIVAKPFTDAIGEKRLAWSVTLMHDPQPADVQEAIDGNGAREALREVNALRARAGLPSYIFDAGLTEAAKACASYRAANGITGHVGGGMSDFSFLPTGTSASAAGCACWPVDMTFGSCCLFENWTYAGAATVRVGDRNFHHLFVR